MTHYDFHSLQNGSDIRGIALPGVKGETPNLTPETACFIAGGFLRWLCETTERTPDQLKIAIGRDPRLSGEYLLHGIYRGLARSGSALLNCGLASTPAMFLSTIFPETGCDGAMMLTASHLPWNRNGIKFFDRSGGLQKEDITRILDEAVSLAKHSSLPELPSSDLPPASSLLMDRYEAHLRQLIREAAGMGATPLAGMHIIVDAGNGSGGFFADRVLAPLGADISGSQFLTPDGHFPHHIPNPEDATALSAIRDQVRHTHADLGLIFDTDVDRSAAVDGQGRTISRNRIVALASALVAEDHPGSTVVTDSITSTHLTQFLEHQLGLHHYRYRRGYKNVINKARELNQQGQECWLAIETSGHAAMKENYFLDDGAYLAARIVIKAAQLHAKGQRIDDLLCHLQEPAETREVRMKLLTEDHNKLADRILSEFRQWAEEQGFSIVSPNYEGVRLFFDAEKGNGWCLLRKSLHDPLMPLNIESDEPGGVKRIAEQLRPFLCRFDLLDTSNL